MYECVYVFKILTIHSNHHSGLVLPESVVLAITHIFQVRKLTYEKVKKCVQLQPSNKRQKRDLGKSDCCDVAWFAVHSSILDGFLNLTNTNLVFYLPVLRWLKFCNTSIFVCLGHGLQLTWFGHWDLYTICLNSHPCRITHSYRSLSLSQHTHTLYGGRFIIATYGP